LRSAEYRYGGQKLSRSQSFVCRVSRKNAAMIKGSLSICDEWCTTSCDAYRITNLADFFCFANLQVFCFSLANPSDFLFGPSQKGIICSSEFCLKNITIFKNQNSH
jgi:hypothetical protein